MDPLTLLNAAGNIAQFVEYTRDVYVQIGEIRSSSAGITRRNTEVIWSATELTGMIDTITGDMRSFHKAETVTERRIREIGQKCQALAVEVQKDIERNGIRDRAHLFSALKSVAFKSWKPNELEAKLSELDKLQDFLFKNMIIHISNQQNNLRTTMARLVEQNSRLGATRESDMIGLNDDLLAAVSSFESINNRPVPANGTSSFCDIREKFETWTNRTTTFKKEQAIISSLYFDGMSHRRANVLDPHGETFGWIYDQRLHFKDWLENDEGIYWITGDAGSGKSTLMKFLSDDKLLDHELARWAGSKNLVKASFFFWFSGTALQKSQEGLLRSLLFEIFRQCPSVIPSSCPERWNEQVAKPWSRHELMQTIRRLDLQAPNSKFCLFIDGLDEYHEQAGPGRTDPAGSSAYVNEIIEVMDALSKLENVKVCLSSRPWHAFEEAYGASDARKLYVNEENRGDIQHYVQDKFAKSVTFKRTNAVHDSGELSKLVDEIVANSNGVFLWVSLVVESLLRGLSNKDRVAELRERVAETPRTLNGIFERMLSSVEDRYQKQAAQILQVALYANDPLSLFAYSYIGEKAGKATNQPIRAWTEEECRELAGVTETRIKVRCPDLIKVNNYMQEGDELNSAGAKLSVEFLHRTVGDFLAMEETQSRLQQTLKSGFDQGRFVSEALLLQIKGYPIQYSPDWDSNGEYGDFKELVSDLLRHARLAERHSQSTQADVLAELETCIAKRGWTDGSRVPFLALLLQRELRGYVQDQLPAALTPQPGSLQLLQCALMCPIELTDLALGDTLKPGMVSLLLQHGAEPNAASSQEGDTIWEHFLKSSYRRLMSKSRLPQQTIHEYIEVMQSMLEYGADANVRCRYETRSGKVAVMNLIDVVDELFHHLDTAYLEALIHEKSNAALQDGDVSEEELVFEDEKQPMEVSGGWTRSLSFGLNRPLSWLGRSLFTGY